MFEALDKHFHGAQFHRPTLHTQTVSRSPVAGLHKLLLKFGLEPSCMRWVVSPSEGEPRGFGRLALTLKWLGPGFAGNKPLSTVTRVRPLPGLRAKATPTCFGWITNLPPRAADGTTCQEQHTIWGHMTCSFRSHPNLSCTEKK